MPKSPPAIWRVEIVVAAHSVPAFETVLDRFTPAVSWFLDNPEAEGSDETALWRLEGFSKTAIDRASFEVEVALAAVALNMEPPPAKIEQVPDTDWVSANLRDFPPISIGRFFVHGSHFTGRPPPGRTALLIDAGAAFGSGEHASTCGCLRVIDRLLRRRQFRTPLDLGCGSGILAIAIAKASGAKVRAADIDPLSVEVAAGTPGVTARRRE